MTHNRAAISDFMLERYVLGELPDADRARVAAALRQDPDIAARLAVLSASNVAMQSSGVLQEIAAHAAASRKPLHPRYWPAAAAAAVVAAIAIVSVPQWRAQSIATTATVDAENRVKGGARLLVFRKTATGSELLNDGDAARQGDLIRIGYDAGGNKYGAIVSVDGRGVVTRHWPIDGTSAAVLQPGGRAELDRSFELDDAPRWEQFFFVASDAPFDVDGVIDAIKQAPLVNETPPRALAIASRFQQSTFTLRKLTKETRP